PATTATAGSRRDVLRADLGGLVHIELDRLHASRARRIIVTEPGVERDYVLDDESGILNTLTQILQRALRLNVRVQFHRPRLDRVITRLCGDGDLGDDVQLVPAKCAGVEAIAEGL